MAADENLNGAQFPVTMRVKRKVDNPAQWGTKETVEREEPVIHRGVAIGMTPERAARFHAAKTPEEKAQVVLEHLNASNGNGADNRRGWGGGTGQHWTTSPSVARGFSGGGAYTPEAREAKRQTLEKLGLPEDIPVIFHAEPPAPSHVYSEGGQAHAGFGARNHPAEQEVTLRRNAPVKMIGMSFPDDPKPGPQEKGYGPFAPVRAKLRGGSPGKEKPY